MSKSKIRVLVVDDHPIVRVGLIAEINLDKDMVVVGEAEDGEEAVVLACQLKPDVVLLDLILPKKSGVQVCNEIIQNDPEACILILTSFTEENDVYAAVKAGASGYIFKDTKPHELLQAIRDVYQGIPLIDPSVLRRLSRELRNKEVVQTDQLTNLTERELDVLRRVALGAPYKEIGRDLNLREATIRTHVSKILNKLNLSNRSQLVLYAIQQKLVDPENNNTD